MTPQTIETIREVLETEIETSAGAMDAAKRKVEHIEHSVWLAKSEVGKFNAAQRAADARRQLDAETERHQRAKTALEELNATYPKGNET